MGPLSHDVSLAYILSIEIDHLIRVTLHTRLKARDYCNLRALIGRKGGDQPFKFTWHTKVKA